MDSFTVQRTCEWCGEKFEAKRCRVEKGQARFCCVSHGRKAYLRANPKTIHTNCEWCQKPIETIPARVKDGRGRFCSQSCARFGYHAARLAAGGNSGRYGSVRAPEHPLAGKNGTIGAHRLVLYEEIGPGVHACHWCRTPVEWRVSAGTSTESLTVDHLDNDGRNNDVENLAPSCHRCNSTRQRTNLVGDKEFWITMKGNRGRHRAVQRKCETCDTTFLHLAADKRQNRGRFCSTSCARRAKRKTNHVS